MRRERWLDQDQAERFTRKNRVTLWHWRETGRLPYKRIGKQVFYALSALKKFKSKEVKYDAEQGIID